MDQQVEKGFFMLQEKKELKQIPGAKISFPPDKNPSDFHGRIVECTWDEPTQSWKFLRLRTDKLNPNSMDVFKSVKQSIDDNITQEELLDIIDNALEYPAYQRGQAVPQIACEETKEASGAT